MVKQHKLSIMIQAQDLSQKAFSSVRNSLNYIKQSFGSANDQMSKMLGGMAQLQMGVNIIKNLTSPALTFEAAMKRAEVTSGATAQEMYLLSSEINRLAKEQKLYSKLDIANTLKALTEAGFNAQQSFIALESSLNLATVAETDGATAAALLKSALVSYNLSADDATKVSDILSQVFLETGTAVADQVSALEYLGQTFSALGIPIETAASLIGVLGDLGIKGTRAMSSFGSALTDMIDPGSKLNDMLMDAGVNVDGLALGTVSLQDIISQLGEAFDSGRLTATQLATIVESRTANAFLGLAQNAEYVDSTITAAQNSMGATEIAAAKLSDTTAAGATDIQKSFEDLRLEMGEALVPALIPMLDMMKKVMSLYEKMPAPIQELIPILIASAAAIAIVNGAMMLVAVNPVTLTIMAIVVGLYLGYKAWQKYGDGVLLLIPFLFIMKKIMDENVLSMDNVKKFAEALITPFETLYDIIKKATDAYKDFSESGIGKVVTALTSPATRAVGAISGVFHPISRDTEVEHSGVYRLQKGEIVSPGSSAAGSGGTSKEIHYHINVGSVRNDRDIRMIEQAIRNVNRQQLTVRGNR